MKNKNMLTMITAVITVLLCMTLMSGAAFAHGGGDSGGSSSSSGGGKSKTTKEATSSYTSAMKTVDKVDTLKAEAGGSGGESVELSTPGAAVTAMQGQAPSSDKGLSAEDKARLDGVSVNKSAPLPTKMQ